MTLSKNDLENKPILSKNTIWQNDLEISSKMLNNCCTVFLWFISAISSSVGRPINKNYKPKTRCVGVNIKHIFKNHIARWITKIQHSSYLILRRIFKSHSTIWYFWIILVYSLDGFLTVDSVILTFSFILSFLLISFNLFFACKLFVKGFIHTHCWKLYLWEILKYLWKLKMSFFI